MGLAPQAVAVAPVEAVGVAVGVVDSVGNGEVGAVEVAAAPTDGAARPVL